jgi:ABC-2 type transport system ATP-binding protein
MSFIKVNNLTKNFRIVKDKETVFFKKVISYFNPEYAIKTVVNNISFSINKGEKVALIGPNGAGKSTTIRMLTGISRPTNGEIQINGLNPFLERKKLTKDIAVVFGNCSQLWQHLTIEQNLKLQAAMYKVDYEKKSKYKNYLIEKFNVSKLLDSTVKNLSLGEKMKIEIVSALIHSPKILFLDEPTIGLDFISQVTLRDLLVDLCKEQQITLLLTSHDTRDIQTICDRVIILNNGKLVLDEDIDKIKNNYLNKKIITIFLNHKISINEIDDVKLISRDEYSLKFEVNPLKSNMNKIIAKILSYPVSDITIENLPLEDVIVDIYRKSHE